MNFTITIPTAFSVSFWVKKDPKIDLARNALFQDKGAAWLPTGNAQAGQVCPNLCSPGTGAHASFIGGEEQRLSAAPR
ncbi:uncharacterized protein LOC140707523 [Pogona vitticeps]